LFSAQEEESHRMTMTFTPSQMVQELARHSQRPTGRPGPHVISLATGDPDFPTPEHISQALADALAGGATHYAPGQGDPELRAALADHLGDVAGRGYEPAQVLVTHGATAALAATVLATVDAGQRVIVPEPTYSLYADLVRMAGGEVVFVRHRSDLHLDLDRIAAEAADARMVVVCNPCNPTGAVYTEDELEELAEIAAEHDLLVVGDEAYDHLVFDGVPFVSMLEIEGLAERLVHVQTFSKTHAMCGWRIGYLAASREVVAAASRVHQTFNGPVNSAVQRAALVALADPGDWPERMRREYQARRDIVTRMVAAVPGLEMERPEGTFYAFLKYGADVSSQEVRRLALERGVAVRAGSEFGPGGEGFVRIAFSTARELLVDGMERLIGVLSDDLGAGA
jgi:aspartate/methionine/tyrosine aminotransferase